MVIPKMMRWGKLKNHRYLWPTQLAGCLGLFFDGGWEDTQELYFELTTSTSIYLVGNWIYSLEFYYNQPVDVCFGGQNFVRLFTCSLCVYMLIHIKIINDQDDYDDEEDYILIYTVMG